jgi:hypothetical protein
VAERTLSLIPSSGIRITHVNGGPIRHPNILNDAQWGNAFSWETPNTLAFVFPDATTTVTFDDRDGVLTGDPVSGATVTDQQLTRPVTLNGITYTPSSTTTLWQNPAPVFLENEYEVTLVDAAGNGYRMVGVGITQGYSTTVVGVAFDGPAPPPGTVLFYRQGNTTFTDSGQGMAIPDMVPCFHAGTLIETPAGPRRIEDLQPGDPVLTLDTGPLPIRWIGRARVCGQGALAPIRIAAGALGNARDLRLSPNHRVFLRSAWADLHFGEGEVLVAAKHLVDGGAIRRDPVAVADYLHLMLDTHEMVFSEGIATESLLPGPMVLQGMDAAARAEIRAIFPGLALAGPAPARTCLRRGEARLLLARHRPPGVAPAMSRADGLCCRIA